MSCVLPFFTDLQITGKDKCDDEESSLDKALQRNPAGYPEGYRAERDGRNTDEYGFRAAHRTGQTSGQQVSVCKQGCDGTAHYSGEVLTGTC